jgi:hypothetical protein
MKGLAQAEEKSWRIIQHALHQRHIEQFTIAWLSGIGRLSPCLQQLSKRR